MIIPFAFRFCFSRRPVAAALLLTFSPLLLATELETVVVTASRQAQRANEVLADITVLEADDLAQAGPNSTVSDILARQPGIEIAGRGGPGTATEVMIRGTNSGHTLVLVDGIRVGSATLGAASWGYLPLSQINRIEILRGPASSLYGSDAMGGVVQIFTRRGEGPVRATLEIGGGTYNTSSLSAGLSGSTPAGWRYSLQVADQRSDGFSAVKNPGNSYYNADKDGYQMLSSAGQLAYSPSTAHEFGASYLYNQGWNRYDSSGPKTADWKQEQVIGGLNLYSRNQLLNGWTSTVRLGTNLDDSVQFSNARKTSSIRTDQNQLSWQNDIKLSLGVALLGIERLEQQVSGSTAYALKQRSIDSYLAGWTAKQGNHHWQFNLRQDHNSQFGDKTTGSVAYGYQFTPSWRGSMAYGSGFKAPTFNQLYWPGSGNPKLRPETSENREVALHYDQGKHRASLTYFENDIHDLIEWAPVGSVWLPSNVNKARLTGWTLAYTGELAGLEVGASLDLQNAQDTGTHKQLRYRAREHGTLSVGQTIGAWQWRAEAVGSGKRYNDSTNTQVLGGYGLVNLQLAYQVQRDWSVFVRGNNVFDKQYELVGDFATPGANFFAGLRYAPK